MAKHRKRSRATKRKVRVARIVNTAVRDVAERRYSWWPALLVLGLSCSFCWPVFTGRLMVPVDCLFMMPPWIERRFELIGLLPTQNEMLDPIQLYLPWRRFAVDSLRSGIIPLWNPYSFCGAPFLANLQSAVLYPPNLLFLLTGAARGFGIGAILHLSLGGCFMFGLLRALRLQRLPSLIGAAVFMFNGFTVSWLEYPHLSLWTLAWLPLILWQHELGLVRRTWLHTLGCGAAVGLVLLGGHAQMAVYVLLALGLYAALRGLSQRSIVRSLSSAVVSVSLGTLLASAQLLPTVELDLNSLRVLSGAGQALSTRLPWTHLVIYLIPDFFGSPAHHNYWGGLGRLPINYLETSGYVGIVTLLLSAFGVFGRTSPSIGPGQGVSPSLAGRRRAAHHLIVSFPANYFALMATLGILVALGTPAYYLLYFAVPGFGQFRGLARILSLVSFGLAGLSALGAHNLMARERRPRAWIALVLGGALILLAASATAFHASEIGSHPGFSAYLSRKWALFAALVASAAVLLFLRLRQSISARWFGAFALAFVICDLYSAGLGFNPAVDSRLDFFSTEQTDFLRRNIGHYRMTSIGPRPATSMEPNTPLAYRLRDVHGYDSLVPAGYERFLLKASGGEQFRWPVPGDPFLDRAGVRYLLTVLPISHPDWELLPVRGVVTRIYRNRRARPRAYLLPARSDPIGLFEDVRTARFIEDATNHVTLLVQAKEPSRLVLSDTAYPGWCARLDGAVALPAPAPLMFRAVEIPRGSHQVEWRYEPASFRVGLFLSLLTCSGLAAALAARMLCLRHPHIAPFAEIRRHRSRH